MQDIELATILSAVVMRDYTEPPPAICLQSENLNG